MLSQEVSSRPPQGKMGVILDRLSSFSHELPTSDPVEAKIRSMKDKTRSFQAQCEAKGATPEGLSSVQEQLASTQARFTETQAQFQSFDTLASRFRNETQMKELEAQVKAAKLEVLLSLQKDEAAKHKAEEALRTAQRNQKDAEEAGAELGALYGKYKSEKELDAMRKSSKREGLSVMLDDAEGKEDRVAAYKKNKADIREAETISGFIGSNTVSEKTIEQSRKILEQKAEEARELYQTELTGYLFARNKELFKAEKGSLDAYDTNKEGRQIEGVIRALNGEHLHMGTGEGKSTVVLPMTAIVDAATNGDGRVMVGSANSMLVDELKENTQKIAGLLNELPMYKDGVSLTLAKEEKDMKSDTDRENILRSMNRDYLTKGELSHKTKEKIRKNHWESYVKNFESSSNDMENGGEGTYLEKGNGKISIFFAEEKKLVFDWMQNPELFESQCPSIYMDEAHVAYDKKTPYAMTNPSIAVSNHEVREGVVDWVTRYMVAQKITPADVVPSGGEDEIRDDALAERIRKMDFKTITVNGMDEESKQFRTAVDIIMTSLGESPNERAHLQKRILKDLQTMVASEKKHTGDREGYSTQEDYLQSVANDVARFVRLKNKEFVESRNGIVIRDSYVDELMSEHKYEPRVQATVLALTGKFEPIKRNTAFKNVTYPSFVHAMKDNIVALSGTLMYPDPQKARMKKGSFASFLETETGRKVTMLAVPEIKPFPKPRLYKTTDEMEKQLARDLAMEGLIDDRVRNQKRPTLIVDFNGVESTNRTAQLMTKMYGEDRVAVLLSRPTGSSDIRQMQDDLAAAREEVAALEQSDDKISGEWKQQYDAAQKNAAALAKKLETDPVARYQAQFEKARKQLANGEIDVLISSGSAALGVNFQKADGSFPDLRTVMLGLPDSEERIAQTIGRRRMKENETQNHFWYLSAEALDRSVSLLQSEDNIYKFDLKKTQEEMHNAIAKALAEHDANKSAKLVIDLMGETRGSRATDTKFQEDYDRMMNEQVVPYAEKHVKMRIGKEMLRYDDATMEVILDNDFMLGKKENKPTREQILRYTMLNNYFHDIGLPSTLYSDVQRGDFLAQLHHKELFPTHFVSEQTDVRIGNLWKYTLMNPDGGFQLNATLNEWFEDAKEGTGEYARIVDYKSILPTLVESPGVKKRYGIPRQLDQGVLDYLREIQQGNLLSFDSGNGGLRISGVPIGGGDAIPVVTDTATNTSFVFLTPGMNLLGTQMVDISDFAIEQMPLTLGLPGFKGIKTEMPIYKLRYTPMEPKK